MSTLEPFVKRIKPAMDKFLRTPTKDNVIALQQELTEFKWTEMQIFHTHIVLPLVLKLEELTGHNQDIRTGTLNCIRVVTANLYLKDVKGLRTMIFIILKQIRDSATAATKSNVSEELKLAAILCIAESMRRSTTDVLETFYGDESVTVLGQLLLTLTEFISTEKYKKLVIASLHCLMVVFYVHDDADDLDVVLRSQVANTLFIFLPKVVMVLFKAALGDDKLGESLKVNAITALCRILCIIYEETDVPVIRRSYDLSDFQKLLNDGMQKETNDSSNEMDYLLTRSSKQKGENIGERLKRMQGDGRSRQWYAASSQRLKVIFHKTTILRSHESTLVRRAYAQGCCSLLQRCGHNLTENFLYLLESVVALTEDIDAAVRQRCQAALQQVQDSLSHESIFDENCELLLDEHLTKLPRIIHRCDEPEQYAELIFLKGFLRNLSAAKLHLLLSVPKNIEMFGMCLTALVEMQLNRDLLNEEYSLRQTNEMDLLECEKLHWRVYRHLSSARCIAAVQTICAILGQTAELNRVLFDHFLEQLADQSPAMNEILLIMLWMATVPLEESGVGGGDLRHTYLANEMRSSRLELVQLLLEEVLDERHWHLALQPDLIQHLRVDKPSDWYVDRTPGLYVSAIEVRKQDYDSDDDNETSGHSGFTTVGQVSMLDAEFNVLHTCLSLDALAHCATFIGQLFDRQVFRCLHKVLLKVASSNSMVYQAAYFTLHRIQRALKFSKPTHLIEQHTDYITYHLNTILKRTPESPSAVDILTVVLQFSSRNALPHLESIFQTIREECAKSHQARNINSYLRVFNAFLWHIRGWQCDHTDRLNQAMQHMQVEEEGKQEDAAATHYNAEQLLADWVQCLEKPTYNADFPPPLNEDGDIKVAPESSTEKDTDASADDTKEATTDVKQPLPRHIGMVKEIIDQVLKLISSSDQVHQILALECLTAGLPLLRDYDDELLPLVHLIWQPLMEKFRLMDPLVLNRCFSLLDVLASHAKDFILKRSLDDVVPFLKRFLAKAAEHSDNETITVKTQEYKLQLKLLQEFANLIQSMQIVGRHLNDIVEVIAVYLSATQPRELQLHAIEFYKSLRPYDSPLVYLSVMRVSHLPEFKTNATIILSDFGIK